MPNASLFTYWCLNLPSLALAALIYLLIGRLVLSFILDGGNAARRLLDAVTDPVVATVGAITPRAVPPAGIVVAAIVWLVAFRIVVLMVALMMGVRL
jgi:hypothetical protein